jgi:hypothetical protein
MTGRSGYRSRVAFAVLALTTVGLVIAGSALASANSIKILVPQHAVVTTPGHSHPYTITLKGFAVKQDRLEVFRGYFPCGPSPVKEVQRHDPSKQYIVHGGFERTGFWLSTLKGPAYVCAYLIRVSSGAVVAHAAAVFEVH